MSSLSSSAPFLRTSALAAAPPDKNPAAICERIHFLHHAFFVHAHTVSHPFAFLLQLPFIISNPYMMCKSPANTDVVQNSLAAGLSAKCPGRTEKHLGLLEKRPELSVERGLYLSSKGICTFTQKVSVPCLERYLYLALKDICTF